MNIARTFAAELWKEWIQDGTPRQAAAIAYYTVFALPALLLVVLSIASSLAGEAAVSDELFTTASMYLGDRTAELLESTLQNVHGSRAGGTWAAYAGTLLLILAATGIIRELQTSLDKTIGAVATRGSLVRRVVNYLIYLVLLLATAAVLIGAIISGTIISTISRRAEVFLSIPVESLALINYGVTFLAVMLMIFMLYFFLPSKRFHPMIVLLCSVIVSSLLVIGTIIASYYVSRTGLGQAYGVAANVLILLFWIYFGANVFLFGAELMEVSERLQNGSRNKKSRLTRLLRM